MAKVKITGHASGTGVLTVTAPNTSTDRTITLPDSTDTLAVNSDVTNKLPLAGGTLTGNTTIATNSVPLLALKRTGNNAGNGYIECHGADDSVDYAIRFAQSNGVMSFDNGGSRIMGVTADGLTFGSDTAAANALDDYEEGTHVVTATMTSSGSVTLNRDTMSYTKVGRLVTCTGEIDISTTSSPSGAMKWTLPFAIANNSLDRDAYMGFKPVCYHVPFSGGIPPVAIGNTSAAYVIFVYEQHDAANASYVPYAGDAFNFSFSYITN